MWEGGGGGGRAIILLKTSDPLNSFVLTELRLE